MSIMSYISNLDIYRSLMTLLWEPLCLVFYVELYLVFFLLLLWFCDYTAIVISLYRPETYYYGTCPGPVTKRLYIMQAKTPSRIIALILMLSQGS